MMRFFSTMSLITSIYISINYEITRRAGTIIGIALTFAWSSAWLAISMR